jgi:hypothetical protein
MGRRVDNAENMMPPPAPAIDAEFVRSILPPETSPENMEQRFAALETELSDLRVRLGQAEADRSRFVNELAMAREEIAHIQSQPQPVPSPLADAAPSRVELGLSALAGALRGTDPVRGQADALRMVAEGDAEVVEILDRIAPYADTSAANMTDLGNRLRDAHAAAMTAMNQNDTEPGLAGHIRNIAEGLVSVRHAAGEVEGDDPDARLARAEFRLLQGDLASALTEVEAVEGPAAEPLAGWLVDARARLERDQAARRMDDLAAAFRMRRFQEAPQ